jgi:hypothetical protein
MNQWLDLTFRFYAQASESPANSSESPDNCSEIPEICPEISKLAAQTLKVVKHNNPPWESNETRDPSSRSPIDQFYPRETS